MNVIRITINISKRIYKGWFSPSPKSINYILFLRQCWIREQLKYHSFNMFELKVHQKMNAISQNRGFS